jgi:hypothetical protein
VSPKSTHSPFSDNSSDANIPPPLIIPPHDAKHKLQFNKIFGAKLFKKKKDGRDDFEHSPNSYFVDTLEHKTIGTKGKSTSNLTSSFGHINLKPIADHYIMKDKPQMSKKTMSNTQKKKDGPSLGIDDRDIFTDSFLQDRRLQGSSTAALAAPAQPLLNKNRVVNQLNSELDELGDDPTENDLQTTTVSEFSEEHSEHTTSTGRRHHLQQIMHNTTFLPTPIEDVTEDSSDMFDPDSLIDDEFTFRSSVGGTHLADMSSPDYDRELDQLDSIRWMQGDSITVQYSPRNSITSMTTRATSNTITISE